MGAFEGLVGQQEDLIRDVPLLARLSEPDVRALASHGRLHTYRPGALIFQEGDPGDSLHIVVEGAVRIAIMSTGGEEATVAILGPGECVGDLALLDGRPRSASAVAAQPTKTLVVTRDDFRQWLADRPAAALALLETLSLRVRRMDEAVADFAFLDLPHRLAKRLLDLAATYPEKPGRAAGHVHIRITQGELASMLGVSRESVNKQLNAFAREAWIALGRGRITITNPEALRTLS